MKLALPKIVEALRDGKVPDVQQELIDAAGGAEEYAARAIEAAIRKDSKGVVNNVRAAAMRHPGPQFELPGMEHASVPVIVAEIDENGEARLTPWRLATLDQLDAENRRHGRIAEPLYRKYKAQQQTIEALRRENVPGHTTGAEIEEMFPRQIEQ